MGCSTGFHVHLNTETRQLVIGSSEHTDDTLMLGWLSVFRVVGIANGTGTATKYSLCVNGKEVRRLTVTQEGKFLSKKSFPTAQLDLARALIRAM